ncbi:MAG: ASKHA domain-containing protein [Alphaproteobacteria bacterium]|nr:ASKHA domain-containing protein [Alphaproteobacteria bacterium]
MTDTVRVVFTPSGRRGEFPVGTPVLTAARKLGVDIDSVCGGRGICGRCKVDPGIGAFAKHGITTDETALSGRTAGETRYAAKRGKLEGGRRLSCQATLQADAVIDVPAESQVHRQVVRKRADERVLDVDPQVKLHYVEVREPDMHDPSGDFRRLAEALASEWDLSGVRPHPAILPGLQIALRKGKWAVTAAVKDGAEVIAVWPGFKDKAYGLAVDVGSTTIAAHLTDLESGAVVAASGAMNPQIRFGEDLMSRVSYSMMNPGGAVEMTAAVREALSQLAADTAAEAGIAPEDILSAVVVGNPVMHHLVLGIDPVELGGAPFALALDEALEIDARTLDWRIAPGASVYVLPCIAGHVGADAAAVALAEAPHKAEEMTLIVDVGTNAEIILGNRHRLLAASSPTGPAFEGAQISSGQRAAPGAIERVRIDPETLEPKFKVIGSDLWSDEDDFAEETRKIGITGICGSGIIEVLAEMFLARLMTEDGVIDGTKGSATDRIVADGRTFSYVLHRPANDADPEIRVTQNDIRAIQLAKAALYAGARLLMDRMETDTVEKVVLAGAFGSHIEPKYAMVLGMIPDCPLDKVIAAGNAAGTGARMALVNKQARAEIEDVVRRIEKVETAVEPAFQAHFVEAMALPHKTADYPNLARAVRLPPKGAATRMPDDATGGRRRRRRAAG